jgi:hypothetical protein
MPLERLCEQGLRQNSRGRPKYAPKSPQPMGDFQLKAPWGVFCKTVGSACVGSNPTPTTTCENGPLAGDSRLADRFFSVPACVTLDRCRPSYCGIHGRIADGVRAGCAVGITVGFPRTGRACGVLRPGLRPDSRRIRLRQSPQRASITHQRDGPGGSAWASAAPVPSVSARLKAPRVSSTRV